MSTKFYLCDDNFIRRGRHVSQCVGYLAMNSYSHLAITRVNYQPAKTKKNVSLHVEIKKWLRVKKNGKQKGKCRRREIKVYNNMGFHKPNSASGMQKEEGGRQKV